MDAKSFQELKNRSIFARLKKLFSDEAVIRNIGGKKLKIADIHNYGYATDRNSLRDRFNRLRTSSSDSYSRDFNLAFQRNRTELFRDYDSMDMDPIVHSVLDIYADECTTLNETGDLIKVYSANEEIHDILDNLFNDILNVRFNLWSWARSLCKYGDFYLRLFISPEYGIYSIKPYSTYNVTRIENSDLSNKNYVKFQVTIPEGNRMEELENYEMIHFRLLSDSNFLPNGLSILEGGRRVFKQLCCNGLETVWTDKGYKYIKDINIGDVVYCFDPKTLILHKTPVIISKKTGENVKTVKVHTAHRDIIVTPTHKLLVKTWDNKYIYKPVNEIFINNHKGDKLIFPSINEGNDSITIKADPNRYVVKLNDLGKEYVLINLDDIKYKLSLDNTFSIEENEQINLFFRHYRSISYKLFSKINNILNLSLDYVEYYCILKNVASRTKSILNKKTFSITFDSDFIRFFGFMLGDGWTNRSRNILGFARGINEDRNNFYHSIISKYCPSHYLSKNKKRSTHPGQINYYSSEMVYIFEELLNFHTGFLNKTVPEWVYTLNKQTRIEFLKGMFDADGSWKWKTLGVSNKKLIEGFKTVCEMSGVLCHNIRTAKKTETIDRYGVHRYPTYKIQVDFDKLYDVFYERVISIEDYDYEDVYNLEVQDELHNYVLNGIVSHNCLLEDANLIAQIMRAPEKRIFKIDVGNAPQNEIENLMERAMNQIQKVPYVDQATGEYNLRFNMMNMMQDFFIPVRGGNSGNSIETLKGLEWNGGVESMEYVKNKMLAAYHVPKAFLGFDESLSGKASLSAEDIRFCRSIQRVQKFLLSGLTEIAIIHLYSLGYRDESLLEFSLEMTNPSTVFEKEKIEIFKEKSNLCQSLQEQKLFSKKWMYQNIFGMSDQDIIELNKQLIDDSKTNFRFSQIENEGSDPYLKFLKTQHGSSSSSENNSEEGGLEGSSGGSFGGLGDTDFNTDDLFGNENEPENNTENNSEKETNKPEKPVTEQWKSPYNKHKNHNKMVKKEWDKKRDQTGRKDASKYPRGEDPLGDKENRAKVNLKESSDKNILNEDIDKNSLKYKMFDENTIDLLNQDVKKSYMDIK